jgi:hypothetical protein
LEVMGDEQVKWHFDDKDTNNPVILQFLEE